MTTAIEAFGYMLGGLFVLCSVTFISMLIWIFFLEIKMRMRTAPPTQGPIDDEGNQRQGSLSE